MDWSTLQPGRVVRRLFVMPRFKACIPRVVQLTKVRILLADDHPGFTDMAERLLEPEFEIVGKVADGQSLFDAAMRLEPEIIVTDISMPVLTGIDAAEQLKKAGCKSRIIFLTVHLGADFVSRCISTGALGFVVKSRIATELVSAVREALAGHIFVSRSCHIGQCKSLTSGTAPLV
jgi:DNA-binding NarL/FixJ family response regulator